jgi:hypothetical protein
MEEYSPEFSTLPDIGSLLHQRMTAKKAAETGTAPAPGQFDPHKLMVKKHKVEIGEELPEIEEAPKWPENDVKALQDYCAKMGIIGFSTRQNPKLALMKLKQQVGDYSEIPLESRIPMGYQKAGTMGSNSVNYPYSRPPEPKKSLLNG